MKKIIKYLNPYTEIIIQMYWVKYTLKLILSFFPLFNVATRKFKIKFMAHITYLLDSAGLENP